MAGAGSFLKRKCTRGQLLSILLNPSRPISTIQKTWQFEVVQKKPGVIISSSFFAQQPQRFFWIFNFYNEFFIAFLL
jgi:hypothetical protein